MKCQWCGIETENGTEYCSKDCYENCQPTKNEKCPDRDTDKCPTCPDRFTCLEDNLNHRIKRAEKSLTPDDSFIVDGIEYVRIKKACVNCSKLDYRGGNFFCMAHKQRVSELESPGCDAWDMNTRG